MEMKRLELEAGRQVEANSKGCNPKAKVPNLPSFIDRKDELDSYLLRFERFAPANSWDRSTWASSLSALFTGNDLQVYGRMSDDAAKDYDSLKKALYRRYDLTERDFAEGLESLHLKKARVPSNALRK